jgi:hypothetical protein
LIAGLGRSRWEEIGVELDMNKVDAVFALTGMAFYVLALTWL